MKVALFSDVHGRIRIVLRMMQCWQIQHETFLDGALLAGDIGCFPDESRFDKATRRWIERDPEEAGFPRFFMKRKTDIQRIFDGPELNGPFSVVNCPILFVAGNHEDYQYLSRCEKAGGTKGAPQNTFAVDCYKRIHCIKNGAVTRLKGADGSVLRIGALWGVENRKQAAPYAISDEAASTLKRGASGGFDILHTHDVPAHSYTGHTGSTVISDVLRTCAPPLHLFGHAHPIAGKHEFHSDPIATHSWIFEDASFGKKCNESLEGAMGVLTWGPRECNVNVVADPWLKQMRHRSWRHVWPSTRA